MYLLSPGCQNLTHGFKEADMKGTFLSSRPALISHGVGMRRGSAFDGQVFRI